MSRRHTFGLVALLTLGVVGLGDAASLSVGGGSVGMDQTNTPRCTNAGLGVIQNLSGSTVISITVSNVPSGCGGAALQVSVNNQTASSSGTATVPAGGGSVTVTLGTAVAIALAEEVDLVMVGP
jgi:hypothetical protein